MVEFMLVFFLFRILLDLLDFWKRNNAKRRCEAEKKRTISLRIETDVQWVWWSLKAFTILKAYSPEFILFAVPAGLVCLLFATRLSALIYLSWRPASIGHYTALEILGHILIRVSILSRIYRRMTPQRGWMCYCARRYTFYLEPDTRSIRMAQ